MAKHSIVGQSGEMPYDMYLRKMEKTKMFENPDGINEFQRTLLMDYRPDPAYMASEEGRTNYDSEARLNLLYTGTRGDVEPFLPDGVNTNFDYYTENSPAGPDMQQYAEQQRARGKFINFYPDDSNDTQESGIAPAKMNSNIRGAQDWVKDRLRIFATSFGNLQRTMNISYPVKSKIELATKDGMVMAPMDDINKIIRPDRTSLTSNAVNLGYRTNVDHRFKVSKYGQSRAFNNNYNVAKNAYEAELDNRMPVSWEGINISPDLARFMADLTRLKTEKHNAGLQTQFGSIKELSNRNFKLQPSDIAGFQGRPYAGSATSNAHEAYDGSMIHTSGDRYIPKRDDNKFMKVSVDKAIVDIMNMAVNNRTMAPRQMNDLRKQIERSAAQGGVYTMDLQNMARSTKNNKNIRENMEQGIDDHYKEESAQIFNYKRAVPTENLDAIHQDVEKYKGISDETQSRAHGSHIVSQIDKGTFMDDGEFGLLEGRTLDRHGGGLGSKYLQHAHFMERTDTGANDI